MSDYSRILDGPLRRARGLGFLGPGPIEPQVVRSLAFAAMRPETPASMLDLGSGGGLPGLALALVWPDSQVTLLDSSERRCQFLEEEVVGLGLARRVRVVQARAEVAGRGSLRASQDLVVVRGFGPPAVTAECAAPLLHLGGQLIVAEPPGGAPWRWPVEGLQLLGLVLTEAAVDPVALQCFELTVPCPDRYPRRVGVPAKRPLFRLSPATG